MFQAAREDVERALELAEALDDRRTMADVFLHASLVAEGMGQWVLARSYAERARGHYQELNDGRKISSASANNLGGLNLLLGLGEQAIEHLLQRRARRWTSGDGRNRPTQPARVEPQRFHADDRQLTGAPPARPARRAASGCCCISR